MRHFNNDWKIVKKVKKKLSKEEAQKLYEEFEKGNSNINDVITFFMHDEEVISRLTEIMAEEYEIKNDEKAIRNIINTYKIEKLDTRKMELLEQQQQQNLTKEEKEKIIEEINEIIIEKKLIK